MKYIAEQYSHYEYPLIPSGSDLAAYQKYIDSYISSVSGNNLTVLICGVTPHLVNLDFPKNTFIVGVDFSEDMVKYVWPGDIPNKRKAIQANWLTMEIEPESVDIILGDGSINFLDSESYISFCKKAAGVLKPKGVMIKRAYLASDKFSPEDCYQRIFAKSFDNLTEFRLQFIRSLQKNQNDGVVMSDVYNKWKSLNPNVSEIAEETGYDVSILKGMDLYKDKPVKLYFHSLAHHKENLEKFFKHFESTIPSSSMGQDVPVFAVREKL